MTDDTLTIIEYCTSKIAIHGGDIGFGLSDLQAEIGLSDGRMRAAFEEMFGAGLCNFLPGPNNTWCLHLLPGNTAEAIWEGSSDVL